LKPFELVLTTAWYCSPGPPVTAHLQSSTMLPACTATGPLPAPSSFLCVASNWTPYYAPPCLIKARGVDRFDFPLVHTLPRTQVPSPPSACPLISCPRQSPGAHRILSKGCRHRHFSLVSVAKQSLQFFFQIVSRLIPLFLAPSTRVTGKTLLITVEARH
jgi:hypothetical protein